MKARLLFVFILMGCTNLWAQDSTKLVTIKTGSRIRDVLTTNDIFLYPQFIKGKVFFKNGIVSAAMMNYNSLHDQMLFIDAKGDSLALTDEKTIGLVALGNDTFYYVNGYIRLVTSNSVVKVAEKKVWEVADIRKIGAQDKPAIGVAVTSYSTITDGFGRALDLILNEDLLLRKRSYYYFGDMFNHFVPAGKKNLLSSFPINENVLANYLKENKINFNKRADLEKVAQFLEQKL